MINISVVVVVVVVVVAYRVSIANHEKSTESQFATFCLGRLSSLKKEIHQTISIWLSWSGGLSY